MARTRREEKERQRALDFEQCPGCGFDFATGEGQRSCHYYECPYIPASLVVFCPTCMYDFYTGEGNPECADPPTCEFATEVAPKRVATMNEWLESQGG